MDGGGVMKVPTNNNDDYNVETKRYPSFDLVVVRP